MTKFMGDVQAYKVCKSLYQIRAVLMKFFLLELNREQFESYPVEKYVSVPVIKSDLYYSLYLENPYFTLTDKCHNGNDTEPS